MQDDKYSNAKSILSEMSKTKKEERQRVLDKAPDLASLDSEIKTLSTSLQAQMRLLITQEKSTILLSRRRLTFKK